MKSFLRYARICAAVLIGSQFAGADGALVGWKVNEALAATSPVPTVINVNNGTDFTSRRNTWTNLGPITNRGPHATDDVNTGLTGLWSINGFIIPGGSTAVTGSGYPASTTVTLTVVGGTLLPSGNPATISVGTNSSGQLTNTGSPAVVHTGAYLVLPSLTNATLSGSTGTGASITLSAMPIQGGFWAGPNGVWANDLNASGAANWKQQGQFANILPLDAVGWTISTLAPTAGSGCGTGETVTFTGGATATVTQSGGTPTALTVKYPGNYTSIPGATLGQVSTTGTCSGVTATNTYTGPIVAYVTFKARNAYSGNLWNLTRPSDLTTQAVGWLSNGQQDTATMDAFCTPAPSTISTSTLNTTGSKCAINTWYDQTGIGSIDATQATFANMPVEAPANRIGGFRSVAFYADGTPTPANVYATLTMPSGVTFNDAASTTIDIYRVTENWAGVSIWSYTISGSGSTIFYISPAYSPIGFTFGGTFPTTGYATLTPQVSTFITSATTNAFDPAINHLQYGNWAQVGYGVRSNGTHAGGALGSTTESGSFMELALHVTYNRVLSAAEREAFIASAIYQLNKNSLPADMVAPQADIQWIADGDSIEASRRTETGVNVPYGTSRFLNFPMQINSFGKPTFTLQAQVANFTTNPAAAMRKGASQIIYTMEACGNDIINAAATAATCEGYITAPTTGLLAQIAAKQTSLGQPITFGLFSTIPNTASYTATGDTQRLLWNQWVTSTGASAGNGFVQACAPYGVKCFVIDWANPIEIMGSEASCTNPLYYNSDGHPTDLGYSLLDRDVADALLAATQ